jgi:hypothetical protein
MGLVDVRIIIRRKSVARKVRKGNIEKKKKSNAKEKEKVTPSLGFFFSLLPFIF